MDEPTLTPLTTYIPHLELLLDAAFRSNHFDTIRPAAYIVMAAPPGSDIAAARRGLVQTADRSIRLWVEQKRPTSDQLRELIAPFVETGLMPEGQNVFSPKEIVGAMAAKKMGLLPKEVVLGEEKVRQLRLNGIESLFFANGVIEVVGNHARIAQEPVTMDVVRALATRTDIPLPCLLPTAWRLETLMTRVLATKIANRCGLEVPIDWVGLPEPGDDVKVPLVRAPASPT